MAVMGMAEKKPAAEIWPMDSPEGPTVVAEVTICLPRS
jgi:hypothetical protein